jgi:hypothetical protein
MHIFSLDSRFLNSESPEDEAVGLPEAWELFWSASSREEQENC